jgi:hypothetical protein
MGTLSAVMPPPTPSSMRRSLISNVRIATLNSVPHTGLANQTPPV